MNKRDYERNCRSFHPNGYNLIDRAYNTSSYRVNLNDRCPSKDRGGNDQEFADFVSWQTQNGNSRSRMARNDSNDSQER